MTPLLLLTALLPLPLPFSRIIPPWQIILYETIVLVVTFRLKGRRRSLLPPSWVNLLALAGLLLFLLDLLFLSRHLIQVADHLTMILLLIKIYSIEDRKDFIQFLILAFFLFISVMASATHVAILLYFLLILPLFLHILITWTQPPVKRTRGLIIVSILFSLIVAVPLFTLMPRMRQTTLPGIGRGGTTPSTGLSRTISLGSISAMREDRRPVLRIRVPLERIDENTLRLKGLTFDYTDGKAWTQSRILPVERIPPSSMPKRGHGAMEIFIHPDVLPNLFTPYGVTRLDVPRTIDRYNDGTFRVATHLRVSFTYTCIAAPSQSPRVRSDSGDSYLQVPLNGIDYRALAEELLPTPNDNPATIPGELVKVFHTRFHYSLHPTIPPGEDPIRYFLTRSKRGHCEFFASSMTLLLRAMKIPARVAGGFLGGEINTIQNVIVVRQRNAHVWVEALVDGEWRVFDPTPPSGRPALDHAGTSLFTSMTDTLSYLWDRYVLPYGRFEQARFLLNVRTYLITHPRFLPVLAGAGAVILITLILLFLRPIPSHPLYRLLRWRTGRILRRPGTSLAPMEVRTAIERILPGEAGRIYRFFQGYTRASFGKRPVFGNGWRGVMILLSLIRAKRSLPDPPCSAPPPHEPSE